MSARLPLVALGLILLFGTRHASAQAFAVRGTPRAGSWELGGGVTRTRDITGPTRPAELTRNGQSSGGFDLFTTAGRIDSSTGASAAIGFYLSRTIAVEAGLRYSQPVLTYRLSRDVEDAPPLNAAETLTRYVFTGSLVWHLRRQTSTARLVPFVAGGAGYIRELHQANELLEAGTEFHALGGVKYWFGTGRRRLGLRGQAGVTVASGGFDFRDASRTLPLATATLVYLF